VHMFRATRTASCRCRCSAPFAASSAGSTTTSLPVWGTSCRRCPGSETGSSARCCRRQRQHDRLQHGRLTILPLLEAYAVGTDLEAKLTDTTVPYKQTSTGEWSWSLRASALLSLEGTLTHCTVYKYLTSYSESNSCNLRTATKKSN
jgi:hypothetical protein